jgi:hypothetical protein
MRGFKGHSSEWNLIANNVALSECEEEKGRNEEALQVYENPFSPCSYWSQHFSHPPLPSNLFYAPSVKMRKESEKRGRRLGEGRDYSWIIAKLSYLFF